MPVRSALKREVVKGRVTSAAISALSTTRVTQHEQHRGELIRTTQQAQVEQHPDRDEEQPEQDVAERTDHRLDLMPVLGLGEHHAGEEGAEREGQSGAVGHPGRGQHHQQHREGEQFAQSAVGDHMKQRPQQPASGGEHRADRQHAAEHRHQALAQLQLVLPAVSAEASARKGTKARSWNSSMAKGEPPVGAVEFGALGELLQQDRGRAHRDRPAEHDRGQPGTRSRCASTANTAAVSPDLRRAQPEHLAAHREHARERELQARA